MAIQTTIAITSRLGSSVSYTITVPIKFRPLSTKYTDSPTCPMATKCSIKSPCKRSL